MIKNNIVTQGLGPRQALVTLGFRPKFIVVTAERLKKKRGRRSPEFEDYDEYKISVYLVEVNGKEFVNPIINNVKKIFETQTKVKVDAHPIDIEHRKDKDFRVWVSGLKIRRHK